MSTDAFDTKLGTVKVKKKRGGLVTFFIRLFKEKPLGTVGLVITLFLIFVTVFADALAHYGINDIQPDYILNPPSSSFWFGTDNLGRDIYSRVVYGARVSVVVGLSATLISISISTLIGMFSGYLGGVFDLIVQRVVDAVMCIPVLILMIVIISVIGAGMTQTIMVIGILIGIRGSRIVRSAVIGVKENVYIHASHCIGCSSWRILFRHILPNIMAPLIVLFSTRVPTAVITEASLSFLGLGVPPPTPSWGGMLSGSGRQYMFNAPWMVTAPGLALASVVYGINIFGDAVRDLLDPRLRGGVGRFR